jgi:hypothetical protein
MQQIYIWDVTAKGEFAEMGKFCFEGNLFFSKENPEKHICLESPGTKFTFKHELFKPMGRGLICDSANCFASIEFKSQEDLQLYEKVRCSQNTEANNINFIHEWDTEACTVSLPTGRFNAVAHHKTLTAINKHIRVFVAAGKIIWGFRAKLEKIRTVDTLKYVEPNMGFYWDVPAPEYAQPIPPQPAPPLAHIVDDSCWGFVQNHPGLVLKNDGIWEVGGGRVMPGIFRIGDQAWFNVLDDKFIARNDGKIRSNVSAKLHLENFEDICFNDGVVMGVSARSVWKFSAGELAVSYRYSTSPKLKALSITKDYLIVGSIDKLRFFDKKNIAAASKLNLDVGGKFICSATDTRSTVMVYANRCYLFEKHQIFPNLVKDHSAFAFADYDFADIVGACVWKSKVFAHTTSAIYHITRNQVSLIYETTNISAIGIDDARLFWLSDNVLHAMPRP